METKPGWSAAPEQRPELAAPVFPGTPSEFITVLAHYHRAEIARMAGWRDRIDRTTNWAITVVGAMLSVSLSTPSAHHGVVLFAMLLVLLLLVIEFPALSFLRRLSRPRAAPGAQLLCASAVAREGDREGLDEGIGR